MLNSYSFLFYLFVIRFVSSSFCLHIVTFSFTFYKVCFMLLIMKSQAYILCLIIFLSWFLSLCSINCFCCDVSFHHVSDLSFFYWKFCVDCRILLKKEMNSWDTPIFNLLVNKLITIFIRLKWSFSFDLLFFSSTST